MPNLPDDFFIQKVFLLETGVPGTVVLRDELTRLYQQNDDLTEFEARIDGFMNQLVSRNGNSINGAVQTLFKQGFDIDLPPEKIEQLIADSLRQGINSWHEYFTYLINELDSSVDKILDNRAVAATAFTNLLDELNIEVNVNDPRVQDWIDQVDATDQSLEIAIARATLIDLINQLTTPVLISSDPVDNAVGVPVNANIVLTFSEAVKAGVGEIVIEGDDGHRISLNVTDSAQVIFNGSSIITLNPNEDLHLNVNYNVQMASGVITDLAGIPFAGTNDPTALNFNTNDIISPTLVSSDPADNAGEVPINANIVLTFSEAVKAGVGEIVIEADDGHRISLNVADPAQVIFNGGSIVTLNPNEDLHLNVNYNVQMVSGVITDLAGNPFAGTSDPTALNFNTNDSIPPTLVSSDPANNADEVPINANIVLTFSEVVKAGTGEIVIEGDDGHRIPLNVTDTAQVTFDGGSIVTLNPNEDLHANVNYHLTAESGVIADLAGNPFAGTTDPTALNFNTKEDLIPLTPPTLSNTDPVDSATEVAIGSDIVLTFSETVRAGSGNIVISDNNGDTRTIPVTDTSQITFSGNTVTINPAADLNPNTTYQVIIDNGAIEDLEGTPYGGSSDLNFDTSFILTLGVDNLVGPSRDNIITGGLVNDGLGNQVNSLQGQDVVSGGNNIDTLNATLNAAVATQTSAPSLTSIEIINIQNVDNDATINFSNTRGAEQIWNNESLPGRTLTYDAAPIAATFGIRNTQSTTDINTFDNVIGSDNLSIAVEGAGVDNSIRAVVQSTTDAANIETMSIDARSGNNFIDVSAFVAITGLTVSGTGFVDATVDATALDTIDASANSGGVTLDLTGSAANLTVTGGSGGDNITAGDGDDTIETTAGNDTIAGGDGADVIDGGDGNDIYFVDYTNVIDASDSTITTTTGLAAGYDEVTANAGDIFQFGAGISFVVELNEVVSSVNITGLSGNDLRSALDTEYRANDDNVSNREAMLIQFAGGEQFLIVDGGSQGIFIDDIVIQVIGNISTLAPNGADGLTIG